MGQENTSAGLLVYMAVFIFYFLLKKEQKIWMFAAIMGQWIGYWILILAPGNIIRSNNFIDPGLNARIAITLDRFIKDLLPIFVILILLLVIFHFERKRNNSAENHINLQIPILTFCALVSAALMVFTKWYPQRASFGAVILLIIVVNQLFREIAKNIKGFQVIFVSSVIAMLFIVSYISTYQDLSNTNTKWLERIAAIEDSKLQKKTSITSEIIKSDNPHNPFYGITDIVKDADGWPNYLVAKYYGIEFISGK
jgi:hypothetical protein